MSLDHLAQKAQMELEASRARKGLKGTVALLVIFFYFDDDGSAHNGQARMDEQGLLDHTVSQAHRVRICVHLHPFDHRAWLTRSQVRQAT